MKGSLVTVSMAIAALASGGAAAYFANRYIDSAVVARRTELTAQYEPIKVVVANTDLRAGSLLSGQTVALREVPRAFLHSEAVPADHWSRIAGRVLAHAVRSGEPLLESHLARDAGAGFSSQLAPGMRAMTFPVDDEASIAGMLAPGDRIDIFFTTLSGNESVTLPLLLDVSVIATGIRTVTNTAWFDDKRQGSQYNTLTVSITPQNAAKLALAQDAGKLTITLRQPADERPVQIARITKKALLDGNSERATVRRARVEIILGGRG